MPPPLQYTRVGDLNIAYQTLGSGPPDLVWCLGSYSHLDVLWEGELFARAFERVSDFARLIVFDRRGVGLSDRPDVVQTIEERTDDIGAVLDAVGSERAFILGQSEGGAMASVFAAMHPERTLGLILHGTMPRWAWAPDWPWGTPVDEWEAAMRAEADRNFKRDYSTPEWRRWIGPALADDGAFLEWWDRLLRSMGSPRTMLVQEKLNMETDIRSVIPAIRAPTLILVREDDPVAPLGAVRWLESHLPDARVVVLPGQGHLIDPDVFDEWMATVEEFITGTARGTPSRRFLTTLVAADIVGSTDLIARVGDATWRSMLDRHYELVARRLAIYGGPEVERAGDGFLARFDGPGRALRFARDLDREGRAIGLRIRAAAHTGEVEIADGALRGMTVHVVSRLASLAAAGEVVVSSTVKDLVAGAGFTFVDRGVHPLKGVPDARQVFALA